jgi:hypothetical protein
MILEMPRKIRFALSFALLTLTLSLPLAGSAFGAKKVRVIDGFERGLSPAWEMKSFRGRTSYKVVPEGDGHALRAVSHDAASALVYRLDYDPKSFPILAWRWKVKGILARGNAHTRSGDDYPARIYVIFPSWFFPLTRSINYIWANHVPKGSMLPNTFTGRAMMFAVESGSKKAGQWVLERRNILEDYRRAFGEDPPQVGAIAVMTDTDNTGGSAEAWYDDIRIEQP